MDVRAPLEGGGGNKPKTQRGNRGAGRYEDRDGLNRDLGNGTMSGCI